MKEYFQFLKGVYFFESLSDEDIMKIHNVCFEERFDAGEVIFFEGNIGERCFIILEGSVEIWKDYESRDRDLLTLCYPKQMFGELALIDNFPRSATAVACEPVRLLFIRRDDFNKVVSISPSISASIMRSVSIMIRERTDNFVSNLRMSKRNLEEAYERLKKEMEERRHLEAQLYQAQKMESIGTLAGGIAHDFNNILCAIFGYAEMTLNNLEKNDENYRNIQEILKSGQRAQDLIRQILTFSRQSEMDRRPLKIQYIIKEALKLIRASLPATIEIRENIDNDCEPVMADPTQIHQVIMNLCTNAYHAIGEKNGIIEVKLDMIKNDEDKPVFQDMPPGAYVKLTVNDNGCGMTCDVMKRIFDPYFTTKERGKGTGLGLSIIHGIVRKHEGYISVDSQPGKGTIFEIYMPLVAAVPDMPEIIFNEPVKTGHERILLVDDEAQIARMLEIMLKKLGYNVKSRTSSVEAFYAFQARPENFDLVISDQTMPNMTGEMLARELIRIRPDIPVILCTGFSEVITEEKIRMSGIRRLVMKPVVLSDIARIIRQILDSPYERVDH